jgi:hypothetical protein
MLRAIYLKGNISSALDIFFYLYCIHPIYHRNSIDIVYHVHADESNYMRIILFSYSWDILLSFISYLS